MPSVLKIDELAVPTGADLGLCNFPGCNQRQKGSDGEHGSHDLTVDINRIVQWGATAVITLNEAKELAVPGQANFGNVMSQASYTWHHLPIRDMCAPDQAINAKQRMVVRCAADG